MIIIINSSINTCKIIIMAKHFTRMTIIYSVNFPFSQAVYCHYFVNDFAPIIRERDRQRERERVVMWGRNLKRMIIIAKSSNQYQKPSHQETKELKHNREMDPLLRLKVQEKNTHCGSLLYVFDPLTQITSQLPSFTQ